MSSSKTDRFSSGRALYPRASAAALPLGRSGLLTWTGFYGAVDKQAAHIESEKQSLRFEREFMKAAKQLLDAATYNTLLIEARRFTAISSPH